MSKKLFIIVEKNHTQTLNQEHTMKYKKALLPKNFIRALSVAAFFLFIISSALIHTSCSTVRTATVSATAYQLQDQSWQQDSLQGYVFIPNSQVKVRTRFEQDSIFTEIRTSDSLSIRSLLINGVSVWIDPEGKQNEKFGIAFPAARAEMMRRQEELIQKMYESGDTLRRIPFDHATWVEAVNKRESVVRDNLGTRFATTHQAKVLLDEAGELVFKIRFAFSQTGKSAEELSNFSIGIISELHQAQLISSGQGQQRTGASDRYGRPRQQAPPRQERTDRIRLIPVKGWVVLSMESRE